MKLNAYLFFDGNCTEAMNFYKQSLKTQFSQAELSNFVYKSCLGGSLDLMTVEQAGQAEQMPDKKDWVMHSALTSGNIELMASDLIMGGKVNNPFSETFFGYFGDVTDKYGLRWMFTTEKAKQ